MSKSLENKLTMYKTVETLLVANAAKTSSLPAFTAATEKFSSCIAAIKAKTIEQQGMMTGKTLYKDAAQEALVESLRATAIGKIRDMDLVNRCTNIRTMAQEPVTPSLPARHAGAYEADGSRGVEGWRLR
jgi:hypothetical protein